MRIKIKSRGTIALSRALQNRAVLPGLGATVLALGADLRTRAEANLDQSGLPPGLAARLKKSIRESFQGNENYILSAGDTLAVQIEDGTQRRGARPWLLPALMDTQRIARERFRALIKS